MKANRGRRGIFPLFLVNLCTRRGWVVKERSGCFTSGRISEHRAFLDGCGKFVPTGIRSLDSPTHSQFMYLLRYHGPSNSTTNKITFISFPLHNNPYWAQASSLSRLHHYIQTHHNRKDSSGQVISPTQRPLLDNTQHSQETDIHVPGAIWTCNHSKREAADSHPR
jgi:hypothetical protein